MINMPRQSAILFLFAGILAADDRSVDPTFLHRSIAGTAEQRTPLTTATCHVKPMFGEGDPDARIARGVARYAYVVVDPKGVCASTAPEREEQIAVILKGEGALDYSGTTAKLRPHDFMYLPPGIPRAIANAGANPLAFILIGYRLPKDVRVDAPDKLLIANYDDVKLQQVGGHPPSTLYRLMMGDTKSTRDRIAAGHVLTSLFVMEFAPGGTNLPHHHDREEEIYFVLQGNGEMVAGGGTGGVENRVPSREGDAFFFRLNCTVGFYSAKEADSNAMILAVRSLYPFGR
jgi:mannose-6-phosphate isomerase-like protein (cupin superfamily)